MASKADRESTLRQQLAESRAQQAASAAILRAMARSRTDATPVFKAVVENAHRVCSAFFSVLYLYDGENITVGSAKHVSAKAERALRSMYPRPARPDHGIGFTILKRRPVQSDDITTDRRFRFNQRSAFAKVMKGRPRAALFVPLLAKGAAVGAIGVVRYQTGPFSREEVRLLQSFADQAVIAIKNARSFNETREALERQTATADILKVIASSPSDVQPVFDTIARSAQRLFSARYAAVTRRVGDALHLVAHTATGKAGIASLEKLFPAKLTGQGAVGRAVLSCKPAWIIDVETDPAYSPSFRASARTRGYRSQLTVPMIREGISIGAITVTRPEPGLFTDHQVDLLKTFADQAVIAIENVRLFNETNEALERQTATSEILGVISSSPTELAPVFSAILRGATRLCDAHLGVLNLYDGEYMRTVAQCGGKPKFEKWLFERGPTKPPPGGGTASVVKQRRPIQFADIRELATYRAGEANSVKFVDLGGVRTHLAVPLLKDDKVVGAILIYRPEVRPFTDKQIDLVQMFANQAVIAIENVRLFNETKESLERQTATAEILKVIAGSPTDVQPAFDAIANSAKRLLGGLNAVVTRVVGDKQHLAAFTTSGDAGDERLRGLFPAGLGDLNSGRAISTMAPAIRTDTETDTDISQAARDSARARGYRSVLAVPMIRDGVAIGSISVSRANPGQFMPHQIGLLETFADQAVIAIENVRLFNETREALERQTATAEVLNVIAGSPTNVQPVLDAVAERAGSLCDALQTTLWLQDGDHLVQKAYRDREPGGSIAEPGLRLPIKRTLLNGRAFLDRKTVHLDDIVPLLDTEFPDAREAQRRLGFRSAISVPMLREGSPIGTLTVSRRQVRPFSNEQISLLETFAAQAVIAIENVRLFNETKESLEQQTATAEILKVIASSPSDVQPVFEAILDGATHLCDAHLGTLNLFDGEHFRTVALRSGSQEFAQWALGRGTFKPTAGLAKLIQDRQAFQHADVRDSDAFRAGSENAVKFAELGGARSVLVVPLLKEDQVLGNIALYRPEVRPFAQKQMDLVGTFASQAVIAIENVRLFNETKEALERQTATAEILKVIASSPSDTQPVFQSIVKSSIRLLGGFSAWVTRLENDVLHLAAFVSQDNESDEIVKGYFPSPLADNPVAAEATRTGSVTFIADVATDPRTSERGREVGRARGWRSVLHAPMVREGKVIGLIHVTRVEATQYSPHQLELLKTFADQAVIAIENVRLFNETKESLERQTATAEILQVISSSPTDLKPVFDAILKNALRLCDAHLGHLGLYDGEKYEHVAQRGATPEFVKWMFRGPFVPDPRVSLGQLIRERKPIHLPDVREGTGYREGVDAAVKAVELGGARSWLAVPMLKEGRVVGGIVIYRPEVRPFEQKQIDLVTTFASQAVIAIENVRLFKELQQRIGQMTALSEVGQAISSTLDIETVLKTIVSRAVQLAGLDGGSIYEFDERAEEFHLRATENVDEEYLAVLRSTPIRKGEGAVGRAALEGEPVQIPDVLDSSYQSRLRDALIRAGYRAVLVVPLRREEQVIGALSVTRKTPGAFAPEVVELLKTFATQSAMAIQNARLFREIAEKGKQLEVASRHKSDFLASMSHELRTPLNAILGFNEMLLGQIYGEVPKDMQEPLEDIQKSGKHLLRLINNVLDLAKIEAGRMELALSDYSVQDTVESVRATLRPLAAEKGLEFVATLPQDLPLAYGDGGRIAQCLMNLAGNSLKFTEAGKVEISVAEKDGQLTFRVADTGIGIAPDKIGGLFTEFKQTDATIASEYGGTGLGLSISRKFVEMHGGRIWIESELGKGSSFIFEIPLRVAP